MLLSNRIRNLCSLPEKIKVLTHRPRFKSISKGGIIEGVLAFIELVPKAIIGILKINADGMNQVRIKISIVSNRVHGRNHGYSHIIVMVALGSRASDFSEGVWVLKNTPLLPGGNTVPGESGIEPEE